MRVINAPYYGHIYPHEMAVFLAGGIKGCRDWQAEMIHAVSHQPKRNGHIVLLNPRAGVFDSNDPACFTRQVEWEHHFLEKAHVVSFWFSKETLNPITLYEFGYQMAGVKLNGGQETWMQNAGIQKLILVGRDPEYQKKDDVRVQARLANYNLPIGICISDIVDGILQYADNFRPR